jgi:hypothetical protein
MELDTNCLTLNLLMWQRCPELKLWYNSNHVVSIEADVDLKAVGYLPVEEYGIEHFRYSFCMSDYHFSILQEYFKSL